MMGEEYYEFLRLMKANHSVDEIAELYRIIYRHITMQTEGGE